MVGRRGRDRRRGKDKDNSSALGLRSLPLARKLAYFDSEFERLQRERRLPASRPERLRVLEPLLRCGACPSPDPNGDCSLVLAAGVLLLLLLSGCLLLCGGPAARFLSFCGRVLLIQLLPYWDWTLYSNTDCLIRNPYYFARGLESLQLTDCINVCQKYPTVESLQKVDSKVVLQKYLRQNLPLVVTDGAEEWVAIREFTVPFLTRMGDHDGDLLMWIAQLQGVFEVQLLPRDICASNCTHYTMQLSPGQTVAVPLRMWEVQYRAFSSTAIGLAATGNWLQDSSIGVKGEKRNPFPINRGMLVKCY
ncbi:uncharacterized protein [Mobula birostris]|uniref:uncharacterized protein isoform X2 n=1 Tax=Mobula birostris TaxID=1983395 RepID=UPI003B28A690